MKPRLLITFDSLRVANTGLHTFGDRLGHEILRLGGAEFNVSAYVYPFQKGFFGSAASYVVHSKLHRWFFPGARRYDLVHFSDQFCRFGPERVRAKTVLTIHDLNQVYELPAGSRKLTKFMKRMGKRIAGADRIGVGSHFVGADVVRHFPEARDKINVIHPGTDFSSAPEGHRPHYVPPGKFLFTIGMLCVKKNFHVLVPLLRGNTRTLVIAGITKGDYKQKIIDEAAAYGVSDRVIITGPVSEQDKNWYYANCEAFVFPSLAEGFGLPVIEAMHHGRPVFLSRLTCLPEVGGEAAYYFEHFEPDHMVSVLEKGLLDFAANDGATAARRNAARFTWEKMASGYLALYRSCLADQ